MRMRHSYYSVYQLLRETIGDNNVTGFDRCMPVYVFCGIDAYRNMKFDEHHDIHALHGVRCITGGHQISPSIMSAGLLYEILKKHCEKHPTGSSCPIQLMIQDDYDSVDEFEGYTLIDNVVQIMSITYFPVDESSPEYCLAMITE